MTEKLNNELIKARQKYLEACDELREIDIKLATATTKKRKAEFEYEEILRRFDSRYSKN